MMHEDKPPGFRDDVSKIPQYRELRQRIRALLTDRATPLIVALDGRSGVGKSTWASMIAEEFSGVVIPGDDFFSGGADCAWDAKSTKEKVADCIDWKRVRKEVLEPLLSGRAATWHPFDFAAGIGLSSKIEKRDTAPLIILDGAYSCRPELADLVDLAVLIEMTDDKLRRKRLLLREGHDFMESWHKRWDSAEEYYFTQVVNRSRFDLIVTL
jgi:uridine kinase